MAISFSSCEQHADEEEDYIDMEVSSSSTTFLCYSISSPPQHREFEFQMSSASLERDHSTSPADELFYKGKLLPLHLPPRLQMVEKLLHNHNSKASTENSGEPSEENCSTPFTITPTATTFSTPFGSCNISPSESCRVSGELHPDEYFFECPFGTSGYNGDQPKKSWSKKLKLIRHSSLGLKLKASRAFLKSLFSKSGCSDEANVSKAKELSNKYVKVTRKNPFGQIQKERNQMASSSSSSSSSVRRDTLMEKEKMIKDGSGGGGGNGDGHRRSFSGAIKRHSRTKSSCSSFSSGSSSSSSFSGNPNGFHELQFLKRSISSNSEIESSIQGAIAHCKQSQQLSSSRNTLSEVGFCSFSASRIAVCDNHERPGLCRG